MPVTITACTDLRGPCAFVAKADVYRWEEDFGVAVDWWPCATPLEEAFGLAESRDERQLRKVRHACMNVRRPGAAQSAPCMIAGTLSLRSLREVRQERPPPKIGTFRIAPGCRPGP